jgi:hypothetical protein
MGIKITGLDEFRRKLDRLSRNAQNVSGPVAFDDLFPQEFMRRYTDFTTIQAMADASGFKIESQGDFEAIPDADWDTFVRSRTRFATWQDMQAKAGEEYIARRLNIENL